MLLPSNVHSRYLLSFFFPSGQHPEARGHLSEALTEDTGVGNSVAGSPLPLTTGNENLDVAIVIHLQYCNHLIQVELLSTVWDIISYNNPPFDAVLFVISASCATTYRVFISVMAVVDQRGQRVAATQPPPQTVGTDSAAGGVSRDQRGQTGGNYIRS